MPFVLLVEPQARAAGRIREALSIRGWDVQAVADHKEALRAAAARAPKLVVVSGEIPEARELLGSFARHRGGPGALVVVSEGSAASAEQFQADALLAEPFTVQDLRAAVERCLSAVRSVEPVGAKDDTPVLSASELFGDVLEEVERELAAAGLEIDFDGSEESGEDFQAPPSVAPFADEVEPAGSVSHWPEPEPGSAPPAIDVELERKLEETLAGVLATDERRQRRPAAIEEDVNALLDRTLAELDLGGGAVAAVGPRPTPASPRGAASPGSETPGLPMTRTAVEEPGAAVPPSRPDGRDFGQYTLEERIAVGGMAEVWRARMKGFEGFQKTVAIKRILPHLTSGEDFVNMFIDEAKLAAQLNHNNIIQIYDLGKINSDYYIAMEFVEGKDLRSILRTARRRERPVPLDLALLIASRLADALDYAHRKRGFDDRELGLVHRDVSPQNVLISLEGDIKLCDFGIAKAVSKVSETRMGALKGKLQYMSPEQAWGRSVDPRSDIFSLGTLLFEMLTGRPLFSGETEVSILEAVRRCQIRDPRELNPAVPAGVARIVLRALAKDPDERYPTAGEFHREVEDALGSLGRVPGKIELAGYIGRLFDAPVAAARGQEPAPQKATAQETAQAPLPPPLVFPSWRREEEPEELDGSEPAEAGSEPAQATPPVQEPPSAAPEVEALPSPGELEFEDSGARGRFLLAAAIAAVLVIGGLGLFLAGRRAETPAVAPAEALQVTRPEAFDPLAVAVPEDGAFAEAELPPPPAPDAATDPRPTVGTAEVPPSAAEELAGGEGVSTAAAVPPPLSPPVVASEASSPGTVSAAPVPDPAIAGSPPPDTAPEIAPPALVSGDPIEPEIAEQPLPGGEEVAAATAAEREASPPEDPTAVGVAAAGRADEPGPASPPGGGASAPAPGDEAVAAASPTLAEPGPGVVPPKLVSFDKPEYPPMARKLRVEGTVVVSLLVDEGGRVIESRLVKSVTPNVGINDAVLQAARSARFEPATKEGMPVKMWYNLIVPFKL